MRVLWGSMHGLVNTHHASALGLREWVGSLSKFSGLVFFCLSSVRGYQQAPTLPTGILLNIRATSTCPFIQMGTSALQKAMGGPLR